MLTIFQADAAAVAVMTRTRVLEAHQATQARHVLRGVLSAPAGALMLACVTLSVVAQQLLWRGHSVVLPAALLGLAAGRCPDVYLSRTSS